MIRNERGIDEISILKKSQFQDYFNNRRRNVTNFMTNLAKTVGKKGKGAKRESRISELSL